MANKIVELFTKALTLSSTPTSGRGRGGWFNVIKEPFTGAWQQNQELRRDDILAYHAVYACITLIANDISKLGVRLVQKDENDIWVPTTNPAYSPVLRKPNRYQTRTQFFESWVLSILMDGNTYVLKERDNRNVVTSLYILDPLRVQPMVADDGSIFYQLDVDSLSGVLEPVMVPDSEIIHDRTNPFYHPLCGISPIYACALPVLQGTEIQKNSASFFKNHSRPGGILTAPGAVSDDTVQQLRNYWETNYTGNNAGKVAVLADGLTYKSFDVQSAANSQVIEQLKWTAEVVCSVFHVPPYKIGVGSAPTSGNIQSEQVRYYGDALHKRIEDMEILLDEGLNMSSNIGVEFEIDTLLRMDSKTMMETQEIGVGAGIIKLNEARKIMNKPPMEGGDTAYLQQQNYAVSALAKRDAKEDPFATGTSSPATTTPEASDIQAEDDANKFIIALRTKAAERFIYAR